MEQSEIQVTNSQAEFTLHVTCPLMLEEDREKMAETMMAGIRQNLWKLAKHAWLHSDLPQALEWRTFGSSGYSAEGTFISMSVKPYCW